MWNFRFCQIAKYVEDYKRNHTCVVNNYSSDEHKIEMEQKGT